MKQDISELLRIEAEIERRKKTTKVKYADKWHYIEWKPQPRQLRFLQACGLSGIYGIETEAPEARIIGYGGAAGGGKSDALLAIAFIAASKYPRCNIGYFRREYPQLEGPGGAIMRSQELFNQSAKWNGSQLRWTFPNNAILEFCHCKSEEDVYNYQSQQFDIILIDEGTQFTLFIIRYLLTRNRATVNGITPFMAIATNPGNVGHAWFKSGFYDLGAEIAKEVEVEPGKYEKHIFIPAKLSDNKILEDRDPQYRKTLEVQPDDVKRMLLDGDFDIFSGQYFNEFRREIHVTEPFDIPQDWRRYVALDYGLDMLAAYWIATDTHNKAYVYKEVYQSGLIVSEAAKAIKRMTTEKIYEHIAPPDLWNKNRDTGKSTAEIFSDNGIALSKASNNRVQGWYNLKEWLKPYDDEQGTTTASLTIFKNCANIIRCLPQLQHDDRDPNDVANEPHELTHGPDAIRYWVAGRPCPTKQMIIERPKKLTDKFKEYEKLNKRRCI